LLAAITQAVIGEAVTDSRPLKRSLLPAILKLPHVHIVEIITYKELNVPLGGRIYVEIGKD
jgi:hypothetical protein